MRRNLFVAFFACFLFACESGGGAEGGTSAPKTPTADQGTIVPDGGGQGNDTASDTAQGPEESTVKVPPEVDPYAPWPAILEGATAIWDECQSKFEDECRETLDVAKVGTGEMTPEGEALMKTMCPGTPYAAIGWVTSPGTWCLKAGGSFSLCNWCADPDSECAKPCNYVVGTGQVYFEPKGAVPRCGTPDGTYLGEECASDAECTQKNPGTGCIVPSTIRAEYHSCRKEPHWNAAVCKDAHFTILRYGE